MQGDFDFEQGTVVYKKRKLDVFREKLAGLISSRASEIDDEVFRCCLVNGFLPNVAKGVYVRLRDDGLLKNEKTNFPRYSAEAMKSPRKLEL